MATREEMNQRERIDRILMLATGKTGEQLEHFKQELAAQGVVIKVERELHHNPFLRSDPRWSGYERAKEDMAGYVAVEPLVLDKTAKKC